MNRPALGFGAAALLVGLAGCGIRVGRGQFLCDPDYPRCPAGWYCQVRGTTAEYRCYPDLAGQCGDGVWDPDQGEECDTQNYGQGCAAGAPVCAPNCRLTCTDCGNGIIEQSIDGQGEQCDCGTDPDTLPQGCSGVNGAPLPGSCRSDCTQGRCGDNIEDPWEQCDDGNNESGDGCSADCLSNEKCGNGFGDFLHSELCDDGNVRTGDGCGSDCQPEALLWTRWENAFGRGRTIFASAFHETRGTMVVFGGWDGQSLLNDLWEYDGQRWTLIQAQNPPSPRYGHAMAYDASRDLLVVHGGKEDIGAMADTWEFNGLSWQQNPAASNATALVHAAMAYDHARTVIVMFGGSSTPLPSTTPTNRTWEYDGTIWTDVTPALSPPARYMATMVYDSSQQKMVLFGGQNNLGRFSDTWEYDGNQWQQAPGTFDASPPARSDHVMAFDTLRSRVVLFGGNGRYGEINDTWEYDGVQWIDVSPTSTPAPPGRRTAVMVYDPQRGRSVVFAGEGDPDILADTWEFDGSRWTEATPPMSPPPRWGQAMVYDPVNRNVLLFGGRDIATGEYLSDTWLFDGEQWLEVVSTHDASPPPRAFAGIAYDAGRQRVVLFGGGWLQGPYYNDTWEFDGTQWTETGSGQPPEHRVWPALVHDPASGTILLFGGLGLSNQYLQDTWAYSGTGWQEVTCSVPPPGRKDPQLVYDAARRRMVLFGGFGTPPGESSLTRFADTWELTYDATTNQGTWADKTTMLSPPGRVYSAMIYDAFRGRAVLYGGAGDSAGSMGDTWEYDGYQWHRLYPVFNPLPREAHTMVYDANRRVAVMFGGTGLYDETWELSFLSLGVRELCGNGLDDDGDGFTDCDDPDCNPDPACGPPEICDNGMDDDGDGVADCDDPNCGGLVCGSRGQICSALRCRCPGGERETDCADGYDNNCDGLADCADPDCDESSCCAGGGACRPITCLACGTLILGDTTGGENVLQQYGCTTTQASGPESIYGFDAPFSGSVTVEVRNVGQNALLDLFVVGTHATGQCLPETQCIGVDQTSNDPKAVTFDVTAGTRYYVVVDSRTTLFVSPFTLELTCH